MARTLIVWGTSSHAGKSFVATALCRLAARRGILVAPFKAQNMSNNARVVLRPDGEAGEIGSAQYFQALAARVQPITDHNPVLLKPERDTASQVVVHGRAEPALSRLPWRERSPLLAAAAHEAWQRLAARHELIVVEGAGSPAEINLADADYVNLGTARWAAASGPTGALLVTDIDRGGAFAHVHGTWALLPDDLRGLLAGYVLNRFRGDAALLAPGPEQLQALTGLPLAGVLPMWRDHGLPEEDGFFERDRHGAAGEARLRVVVLAPPHISNLDEFAPLARVPGLRLVWARDAAQLDGADWIVLPGSKQVSGDLAWLRERGLDATIVGHARAGRAVLGICGGLQMLGQTLHDSQGHDGEAFDSLPGLALLPLATHFGPAKRLHHGNLRFAACSGPWSALAGLASEGYQIRCGTTTGAGAVLHDEAGAPLGWQQGSVLGLYAHGLFERPEVLRALFGAAVPSLDSAFDGLAELAEQHLEPRLLARLLGA
jgi:adenosylcobyric acid synthase